ncbi:MAG: DUF711 family protein [Clostridium sp.]
MEKLEAMTAVCSVGLDMVVIPGETTPEVISGIIADGLHRYGQFQNNCGSRIPAIGRRLGKTGVWRRWEAVL